MFQKGRYYIVHKIMKILTPRMLKKANLLSLTHKEAIINPYYNDLVKTPRPSILFMKEYFKNKSIKGAEIGVKEGLNSASILKTLNIDKLYLIDKWESYRYFNMDEFHSKLIKKYAKDERVTIIKASSEKAVDKVEDNSLDFVYIDANHDYDYVYQDLEIWYSKVKSKGVIAGHDVFNWYDVLDAVKDFCVENQIRFDIKLPDWYFIK